MLFWQMKMPVFFTHAKKKKIKKKKKSSKQKNNNVPDKLFSEKCRVNWRLCFLFSQMTVSQPNLASPERRAAADTTPLSPTRSVPAGLQKSTETLNSATDPGSIGTDSAVTFILYRT